MDQPKPFSVDDIIESAQEVQRFLDNAPPKHRPELIEDAIAAIDDPEELYGSRNVLVRALGAFVLRQEQVSTIDEELYGGCYIYEPWLAGRFLHMGYVRQPLDSIALQLSNVRVPHAPDDPMEGSVIRSGVFVPINAVQAVLVAPREMA